MVKPVAQKTRLSCTSVMSRCEYVKPFSSRSWRSWLLLALESILSRIKLDSMITYTCPIGLLLPAGPAEIVEITVQIPQNTSLSMPKIPCKHKHTQCALAPIWSNWYGRIHSRHSMATLAMSLLPSPCRIPESSSLLAPTVYAMDHHCRHPEETVFQKPQRHWRFSGSENSFIRLLGFRPWCVAMTWGGSAVLGFSSKVRIGYYSMHSICLILWFQEGTHQAASFGDVPNDQGTERSSFCSAFVSADETTLRKSLTNVCRLWQRDLSFLSSFRVIAPRATAASPENVWMHHRNICWECWMYVLVDSNLSFFSRLVDILMEKTVARMAYLLFALQWTSTGVPLA